MVGYINLVLCVFLCDPLTDGRIYPLRWNGQSENVVILRGGQSLIFSVYESCEVLSCMFKFAVDHFRKNNS